MEVIRISCTWKCGLCGITKDAICSEDKLKEFNPSNLWFELVQKLPKGWKYISSRPWCGDCDPRKKRE